jgi:DNA-binding LacI/PurR family transcriptional regulator
MICFNQELIPHHSLSYAEQIYDILEQEIQNGRWQPGERLPGVMKLAAEIGVGTKTVQDAYEKLKQEGYIQSKASRGTFLATALPESAEQVATFGVLCTEEQRKHWFQLPVVAEYTHMLQAYAHKSGARIENRVVPAASIHPAKFNLRGQLFPENTQGIISLTPLEEAPVFEGDTDRIPFVFLCEPFETCLPRICTDAEFAYRELTRRAIRDGHRKIVYSEDAVEPDPRLARLHFRGFQTAMDSAGLHPDPLVLADSRQIDNYQHDELIRHLRLIRESAATLVVAGSLGRSMALAKTAIKAGIRLPDDLSMVSIGTAPLSKENSGTLSGTFMDSGSLASTCFRLLKEQKESGFTPVNEVMLRPRLHPGNTYAPPGASRNG